MRISWKEVLLGELANVRGGRGLGRRRAAMTEWKRSKTIKASTSTKRVNRMHLSGRGRRRSCEATRMARNDLGQRRAQFSGWGD